MPSWSASRRAISPAASTPACSSAGCTRRGPGGRAVGGRRLPHGVHLPIPGTSRRSSGRDHRDGRHDPLYGWTVEVAMSDGWGLGPLELWGGVECTVNRLGDTYRDQLVLTGHDRRVETHRAA